MKLDDEGFGAGPTKFQLERCWPWWGPKEGRQEPLA